MNTSRNNSANRHAPAVASYDDTARCGHRALPVRKRLDHRGPLSIDISSAWYFITICAEGHNPWVMSVGRDDPIAPNSPYDAIMSTARHFHKIGKWKLALFLVMPDHLHFIVHIPDGAMGSSRGNGAMGSSRPTSLERVIRDFKRSISRLFKIRFQRDFFDTRIRDAAHFVENYDYILGNPVRKGLCAEPSEWPHSIAFSPETGEEDCELAVSQ